ncbi:MAG TPA: DoxX family protein [Acidimicrobiales bacterium]|nr:DoxX family protein [Acidimicrobiales bacterium]
MDDIDAVNLGLLLLRVWVGAVMLAHGIRHIFGGGKIAGTGGWFESLGMKPGIVHAWLASVTEIGAGGLLVVGLLTPLGAAGVVGTMLVAFVTNHFKNGFFIFYKGEGYEYVATLIFAGLALSALGAGEWSLDNALDLTWAYGDTGLAVGAIGGIGGALLLLAGFWRPPPRADS